MFPLFFSFRCCIKGLTHNYVEGTWRGSQVAIKTLHKTDDTAIKMFFKEVSLMCKLRHANIVQVR